MKYFLRKTTTQALGLLVVAMAHTAPGFGGELYCGNDGNQILANCMQPKAENTAMDKVYFTLKVVIGGEEDAEALEQMLTLEKIGDVLLPGERRVVFLGRFKDRTHAFQALGACLEQRAVKCADFAPEVVRIDLDGHDAEADEALRARSARLVAGAATDMPASPDASIGLQRPQTVAGQPVLAQLSEPQAVAAVERQHQAAHEDRSGSPGETAIAGAPSTSQPASAADEPPAQSEARTEALDAQALDQRDPAIRSDQYAATDHAGAASSADRILQLDAEPPSPEPHATDSNERARPAASSDSTASSLADAQLAAAVPPTGADDAGSPDGPAVDEPADPVVDASPGRVIPEVAEARYPMGLLKLPASTSSALWADFEQGKLHVFERSGERFYVTLTMPIESGPGVADRPPLGVYRLMTHLRDRQLRDYYGSGAYTLNYPNAVDTLRSRSGSGLWLHGSARNGAERLLSDSAGGISLSNDALATLGEFVELRTTPVILDRGIAWSDVQTVAEQRDSLERAIEAWRLAWAALENDRYLSFYGADFRSLDKGLSEWKRYKTRINRRKSFIDVKISELSLLAYPGESGAVLARFFQDYKSSNYNAKGWKEQLWRRNADGTWKIVFESG